VLAHLTCVVFLVYPKNHINANSLAASHVGEHKPVKERRRQKQRLH